MSAHFDPFLYGFQPCATARSDWRDMDEIGHLHGIPRSDGRAIATNGILIVVQRNANDYIIGHMDSWVKFKGPRESKPSSSKPRKAKATAIEIDFLS